MRFMKITATIELEDGTTRELVRELPSQDFPDGMYATSIVLHEITPRGSLRWKRWYTGVGAIMLPGAGRAR